MTLSECKMNLVCKRLSSESVKSNMLSMDDDLINKNILHFDGLVWRGRRQAERAVLVGLCAFVFA